MSDATVVTRGAIRFRGQVEWTRYDAVFGPEGRRNFPLGSLLTAELDAAALPLLAAGEVEAQSLAASPSLVFSLGTLTTTANSRVASVPVSIEYGLTSRITLGLMIPIVQSRTVVVTQLNGRADSTATVGLNPAGYLQLTSAYTANAQVTSQLEAARDQLEQRRAMCAANPLATGCPAFNARATEANALIDDASFFALSAGNLYGISDDVPGAPFVPLVGSPIQQAIDARLAGLRTAFTSFGFNAGTTALTAAAARAANRQLQEIVTGEGFGIGLDSIGTTTNTSVGDIEISVIARLFDSFAETKAGVKLRGAASGVVRLGTGHRARQNRPFDVPTGDGQTDVEVRGALDAMVGRRFLTTVAATYTVQLGTLAFDRLPYSPEFLFGLDFPVPGSIKPGNMASIRANPRFLITPAVMVGAIGTMSRRSTDVATATGPAPSGVTFGIPTAVTSYAGGFTISYSNLASATGIGAPNFPAEIFFTHLETLRASAAGVEKTFRDALELRVYFRTRR